MSGQEAVRSDISAITNANPCVVTTSAAHGLTTNNFVRLTDLNSAMPSIRGMDPINNHKFRVIVLDTTNFSLQHPITFENVDSTGYTPYVSGGYCNLIQTEFIYEGDS